MYALTDQPPLVSLILVTYQSAELLTPFLATLAATRYRRYELIVVDNASTDTTRAGLADRLDLRLIVCPQNIGFGRACNQGAAVAQGELLVFLNPDVTFTEAWLGRLVETMQADPTAAIICPETLYPGDTPTPDLGQRVLLPDESAAVPGSAMMVRRTDWDMLGGFDEQIFMYWEDVDLCWRAWLAGRRVLIDRSAIIYHKRGGSGGGGRWDAEAAKNGLYVHLKLMRWRYCLPFIARLLITTPIKALLGRPDMAQVWRWNIHNLGATLAARRLHAARRQIDPARLERLARQHAAAQRRARLWYTRRR